MDILTVGKEVKNIKTEKLAKVYYIARGVREYVTLHPINEEGEKTGGLFRMSHENFRKSYTSR